MAKLIKQSKRTFHPRRWLIGLGVVVLVAAAGVGGCYYWQKLSAGKGSDTAKQAKPQKPYSIQDDLASAKDQLAKAKTKDEKVKAYQNLSNLYSNTDKEKALAVDAAEKMIELDPSIASYSQLGFAAELAGDYKTAATAYRKAAELSSENGNKDERSDFTYFTYQAKEMEKRQ